MGEPQEPQPEKLDYSKYPDDGTFSEFEAPDVTAWKLTRAAIEHENNLVNQRLAWLMTSQAYLFTAFAVLFVTWGKPQELGQLRPLIPYLIPYFMLGICCVAIYICLVIQDSLLRAFSELEKLAQHYERLVEKNGFSQFVMQDKNSNNITVTRTPPLHFWTPALLKGVNQHFLPGVALLVWFLLLALAVWLIFA